MTYDCVIVGAGIAGLTTSAILAKNGMRVALVEKAPVTAPIIRGFSRKGLSFDTGFHYTGGLESGGALDVLLGYLHMQEDLQKIPFDPEGFDVFHVSEDGFEFRFPYGEDRILASLAERFPDDHHGLLAFDSGASRSIRRKEEKRDKRPEEDASQPAAYHGTPRHVADYISVGGLRAVRHYLPGSVSRHKPHIPEVGLRPVVYAA